MSTASFLNLQNLNGNNGFIIPGTTQDDKLGTALDLTGDINGDGFADLVISSIDGGNPSTQPFSFVASDRRGETYVIFGSDSGFNPSFDLNSLDGNNGFVVAGVNEDDNLGNAIAVGDINGDNIDDLALGAPFAGDRVSDFGFEYSVGDGRAYLIFGKQNGFTANFDLSSLDGNNGVAIAGIDAEDNLGTAIASAGDINGDGIGDLMVSAAGAGRDFTNENNFTDSDRRGETYIVFGSSNWDANLDLTQLDGSDGFKIEGENIYDNLGYALNNTGDFNGDGIDDLVLGTPLGGEILDPPFGAELSDKRGKTYVIFGQTTGFDGTFELNALDGTNGFIVAGNQEEDNLGDAIGVGDLNGDGIDDLIVGAPAASQTGEFTAEGGAYVIFGQSSNFDAQINPSDLDGINGFSISGIDADDALGNAVSSGDINGDGIDDLIVGADNRKNLRGEVYLIYGTDTGFANSLDLANLDPQDGAQITGIDPEDLLGNTLSSGGDINGDGIDDLAVSAPWVNILGEYSQEGEVYVIFGNPAMTNAVRGTQAADEIEGTPDPDSIFGLGGDDVIRARNGDDTLRGNDNDDLVLGQGGNDLIFGNDGEDILLGGDDDDVVRGGRGNDILRGNNGADRLFGDVDLDLLVGNSGNDTLNGGGGRDTLVGGFNEDLLYGDGGNDRLIGEEGEDTLHGGDGRDTLRGGENGDLLDGGNDNDRLFGEAGRDTLFGRDGMDTLNGEGNADLLYGNDERDILIGGAGNDTLFGGLGSDVIRGEEDNDVIDGTRSVDFEFSGIGEKDLLFGGTGADIFTLGDNRKVYYDDFDINTRGNQDFARIRDLEIDRDRIKLSGFVGSYSLNIIPNSSGGFNAQLFYNRGDYLTDELIGIIDNVPEDLTINNPVFNII